jgi:hypothetical protein
MLFRYLAPTSSKGEPLSSNEGRTNEIDYSSEVLIFMRKYIRESPGASMASFQRCWLSRLMMSTTSACRPVPHWLEHCIQKSPQGRPIETIKNEEMIEQFRRTSLFYNNAISKNLIWSNFYFHDRPMRTRLSLPSETCSAGTNCICASLAARTAIRTALAASFSATVDGNRNGVVAGDRELAIAPCRARASNANATASAVDRASACHRIEWR